MKTRFDDLAIGLKNKITEGGGTFMKANIDSLVEEFLAGQDFGDLEREYLIPADTFRTTYGGLLKGLLQAYATGFDAKMEEYGICFWGIN